VSEMYGCCPLDDDQPCPQAEKGHDLPCDGPRCKPSRSQEDFNAGVRQAVAWLRADYPYGTGPDWREDGCEWIEREALAAADRDLQFIRRGES